MLVKRNSEKEKKTIAQLVSEDEALLKQHELFEIEMAFKQELINARKRKSLTQTEVSNLSGLSQQAISRLEKGKGCTLETLIRYLTSMNYSLTIESRAK